MPRSSKVVFKKSDDGQYYFVVKGKNGETQCTSETYTRKFDSERGFHDVAGSVLQILAAKNMLIDELDRAGLLGKVYNTIGSPSRVDFIGQRPPERPPRKPSEADQLQ